MTALTIERIAAGGDGVGRLEDGLTVFVPRTAPGDVVEVAVVERKPRFGRARTERLVTPGPERVDPHCAHYTRDRCGGCQLQHLSAAVQLDAKRRMVGDALRRIAHRSVGDPEIVPSPTPWRYRTKITLACAGGRVGFHPFDRPEAVFELEDCAIASERLMTLWRSVRHQRDTLPPGLSAIVLREDRDGMAHLVLESGAQGDVWDAAPLAAGLARADVAVWWRPAGGAARVVAGPESGFPALAFEQINPALGHRLHENAVSALAPSAGAVVWDLYAGVGDTARAVAARGANVWAVEADRSAVAWAERRSSEPAVRWVCGRVEECLHRLPEPRFAIANPPRVGLDKRVTARLDALAAAGALGRVVYVSCDPATLARDLTRMPSLGITRLIAYDLFPQTSHVETLVVLEPVS